MIFGQGKVWYGGVWSGTVGFRQGRQQRAVSAGVFLGEDGYGLVWYSEEMLV